jgi:predicted metalloprotease
MRMGGGVPALGGGLGIVGVVVFLLMNVLGGGGGGGGGLSLPNLAPVAPPSGQTADTLAADADEASQFMAFVLEDVQIAWRQIFEDAGRDYEDTTLVLFSQATQTGCGTGQSATGPFYCPADRQVYIDLTFWDELKNRFGAGGDFAQAYVVAHEVGHHVQTLTGTTQRVMQARRAGQKVEGDQGLLVRQELQADCYAGLWGYHAQQRHQWLEAGDVDEALATASAIGDDRLQKQSQGEVVPDAFTHGTAEQRVRWFRTGFEGGDVRRCDTFAAGRL